MINSGGELSEKGVDREMRENIILTDRQTDRQIGVTLFSLVVCFYRKKKKNCLKMLSLGVFLLFIGKGGAKVRIRRHETTLYKDRYMPLRELICREEGRKERLKV